ncbi:general vesicular transport factor p115 [Folsomia candida]|uniref:Golgin candidate 6 n=1 Tax=Folsomia candida TaxID=158441 RepID=A0A226EGX0_FOLCA|nr:general vesicular transport factor p115 [Folsomia candida]OXA56669.1 Golgin candidate 6 [Folsomia candida]
MELFKSGFKTVLGGGGEQKSTGQDATGAETVERLVERLITSTLLDDRRDACRALKSLSRKYRVEVGAQGMDAILNLLGLDRVDTEIMTYAVECLLNVTSPELLDDEDPNVKGIGEQFTEIISKKPENIANLLLLLEEYDYKIRVPLIRLMTNLLTNRPKDVQEILLVSPMGISKIMDLLSDSREFIRNESILLLIALTRNNASIQKIIAFENGFDRILQIIQEEGYSDGGPVVEDCLSLFLNLLKNNTSNQTFFREGNYVKKLVPFFKLPDDPELGWPTQKVSNFYHMLFVVRRLVSPLNPSHVTQACQKSLKACGILECLCNIILANGIPSETLTEAIATVAEAMRGGRDNQEYFGKVEAPSDPPRPVLVILLMTLVNERQPLSLRCTVLYCIQCYLFKNEKGQNDVVKTLLPASTEASPGTVTSGQLLCTGLFSRELTNNWFSAISLSHALLDSPTQRENLLKVQLATKANTPASTLMNHLILVLQQSTKWQMKIGLLQFISLWLENSQPAITHFLSNPNSVPFLINQITSPESDEKEALVKGVSAFVIGLCLYFNPNTVAAYSKDNLIQLINNRIRMETLTDGLGQISKSDLYLHSLKHPQLLAKHSSDLVFDHSFCMVFKKYESLIVLQLSEPNNPHHSHENSRSDINSMGHMVNNHQSPNDVISRYKEVIRTQDETIEGCKQEIGELKDKNQEFQGKIEEMLTEVNQLKSQLALAQAHRETFELNQQNNRANISIEDHNAAIAQKDYLIQQLQYRVHELEQSLSTSTKNPIQEELTIKLEEENKVMVEELDKMKKDQDELLELLTEQDNKIATLKTTLRQNGIPVEDDQDDILDEHETNGHGSGDLGESLL